MDTVVSGERVLSLRDAAEVGRQYERRRILEIVEGFEWAASISPNGEVTANTLAAVKAAIVARSTEGAA